MNSSTAKSFVSGFVQSYRDAFLKKQVVSPQIVVSLRVSTNWTYNDVDQFDSVINFAFDVSSNYISVFFAEPQAGFNDLSKMDWKFQSCHDSCWREDGLAQIAKYYFMARVHLIKELRANAEYSENKIQKNLYEINSHVEVSPQFDFFIPVTFKANRLPNREGYTLTGMNVL